jgi:predicted RNase H-like nuclease (RuvC/YqgF family)
MATASTPSGTGTSATLKVYEDKINAQIRNAKVKLDEFEAKAATQRTQAENKTIEQLKTTRQNLEQKVRELKTIQAANLERAQHDIDAEVAKLHTSIDKLTAEFNAAMKE